MDETKRFALVIGNSHYGNATSVSGVEDAEAMVDCLRELEFEVPKPILDATLEDMTAALRDFEGKISEATVVLFYYAGHGFQLEGRNFLLPTDGDITPDLSVPVGNVLQALGSASNAIKFVFLDACRDEKRLSRKGLADPGSAPPRVLQAFAASPGQLAASGSDDQLSVYTMALLRYLREPGLELVKLFEKVRVDVIRDSPRRRQHPTVAGAIPTDFFFRPPVIVQAKPPGWPYSPLLVFLRDELVLSTEPKDQPSVTPLRLNAGDNKLVLMVSNGKNYHNGQVWGRTQSWSYRLDLLIPDKDHPEGRTVTFEGREDVPFKDGPHHGQTFIVAQANLFVDPKTAEVTVKDQKTDIAHGKAPFWAQDQEVLFKEKLVNLQISASDVLGGGVDFDLAPLIEPFLDEFLKTGKILDRQVVDADKSFVAVRGNKKLRDVARHCMTERWPDRLRDLRASFAAFFNFRHPRPFNLFAEGLDACIRANAPRFPELAGLASEDLRVWTSLDDFGPEVPAVDASPAGMVAAKELAAAARAASTQETASEETLEAVQDSILVPRRGEVLIETRPIEQVVQGVPLTARIYTFLSLHPAGPRVRVQARVVGDLSDLQNKIGPLINTIPLPTDNCSHFGVDNIVAKVWGKQITVNDNGATLKLNGDVEVWTCAKNPIPCSRLEWEERNVFGATIRIPRTVFFDCNPPIKNRNFSQPFEAMLPFNAEVVSPQSYGLKLGNPSVDLGGPLGGVTEGILRIAGVDINEEAKKVLDRAINPGSLTQTLPDFLIPYNPTLTRAELLSNSGALALTLEAEALLTLLQLGQLIQMLRNRR